MPSGSLALIDSQLKAVQDKIYKAYRIKSGSIKNFAHFEEDFLSQNFYPAVLLLMSRIVKQEGPRPVALAAIIQFIYMAALVHFKIGDKDLDPAETDVKEGVQYPVLVGDYLYGRFFTTLCREGMTEFLAPLAEVICEMNIGGINRTEAGDKLEIIKRESAELLGKGFFLLGQMAEVDSKLSEKLREMGYHIGMGYGLLERSFPLTEANQFFAKADRVLGEAFPPSEAKSSLQKFLKEIQDGKLIVKPKTYGRGNEEAPGDNDGVVPDNYKNKEEYVHDIFSKIAGRYDFLNTVLSLNRDKYWRRFTVEKTGLKPGDKVLDVCCGTGMISVELAKAVGTHGKVIGLDFCGDMLEVGRENLKNTPYSENIDFIQGNAMALPFSDDSFDCATIGFGLRNVPDMRGALKELMRVVKPGGRVVSLEFAKPTVPGFKQVYNFYFENWVPLLGKLGVGVDGPYTYLHKSWKVFPHQKEVREIFRQIGLKDPTYYELTGGIVAVHVGTKPIEEGYHGNVAAAREEVNRQ